MARSKSTSRVPLKPLVYALLALILGIALLIFSQRVKPADKVPSSAAATAPASAPAPDKKEPPPSQEDMAARNLSGILLLFSMGGFLLCALCIGWEVVLIRKARPAWKTQTKYPKMR